MVLSNGFFYERIQLDTINERFNKVPTAKEGDANGRGMIVVLTEKGLVKNTTGVSLLFKWEHTRIAGAQGLEDFEPLDLTKGEYIVTYPTEMNHEGYVKAEIRIIENGKYAGSRNMKIQVEPSVGDDTAMESSNQFSALVTALLQVNSWNTTIDGKIVEWEDDMAATKQLYIDKMNEVDATYPIELNSVKQQLAEKVGGSVKAELEDLSANVLGAIDGTGGPFNLLSIPQDASVTPIKTTFFEPTKNLFDYKQAVFGKKVAGSGAVVDTIETDDDSYVTNVMPVTAGLPYVKNAYGNFAFRDSSGVVIGAAVTKLANSPAIAPAGAVSMVSSLIVDSSFPGIENVQIEQAELCTSFVPYGKLSYKQALDQNEVTLDNLDTALQDIVFQNLPTDDYQPIKKYQAQVKNRTNVVFTDKQIKIHASFKLGEVKNERCIVVKDSVGNTIAHQWEDARNVNLNKNYNAGKYKDGSLRDGYLWIIDTCEASATNVYTVFVYPEEVTTITPIVSVTKNTSDDYTLAANGLTLNFLKAKRYLLEFLNNNGTTETFLQRPAINNALLTLGASPTFYLNVEPKVTVDKFEAIGSGVVFVEAQTTLRFYPSNVDLFSVLVKTRLYANGVIKTECVFKPLRTIAAGEITGVMQRVSLSPNSVITKTTDVTQISWTNTNKIKAILAVNTNGDTPRGVTPTIPELPANVEIVDNSGTTGTAELLLGWKYSNNANSFEIESGKPFTNQIEYNFVGVDSAANEKVRVLNELNGRINDETPAHLKSEILHETGKITRHLLDYYTVKYAGSYIDGLYPPTAAKLALFKLYGIGDLDEISDEYKATLVNRYGTITDADLWTKRKANAFSLDIGGRVFPLAYHFWQEYTRLGNATEKAYYENVISAYAEMLCSSTEQKGFVGLLYSTGYNSNSTATGLRGLAIGMAVFGAGYASGRWQAAYDTNKTNLNLFLRGANVLVDGHTQNLTISNYYHYAMYATYEYLKAVETKGEAPIYDLSSYAFTGSSVYGGLQEHKYCISSSRRGLPHTSAYVVNILTSGNVSDLAQAKAVLQHFVSQNQPTAGISLPLEDFSNPPLNDKSELAICLGAFAELIFKLLNEKVA